ncbi:MAG TPA: protein kinase, partial [Gemmatimonadaceae bacterium]|nr:protein kinase [Gemmatimonadaceae bacterium]
MQEATSAFANYTIKRELGSGGMATVYLAHDARHDRHVALKVLRPDVARSIGAERFLREIHLAAKLSHPHILPLFDSGEANGCLYYVMPNVEGLSLRDRMKTEG